MANSMLNLPIPADVPAHAEKEYVKNYTAITHGTQHLMLFACDQKIEHLNKDFYGDRIHADAMHPEHLFTIASKGTIGAFASHLGLIARYAKRYPTINYIVKLNGKTDLVPTKQRDPLSEQLWSVDDVISLKNSAHLNICGVGYTLYLGSEYESTMLAQAAHIIAQAHEHGLITILWIYPRGKSVPNDHDPELAAGAAGVANALGSDFVKIKAPDQASALRIATMAAGNTKIICSGGEQKSPELFLQQLHDQIHIGGASGSATGRNIFQHSTTQAIALTKAIYAVVVEGKDAATATMLYKESKGI